MNTSFTPEDAVWCAHASYVFFSLIFVFGIPFFKSKGILDVCGLGMCSAIVLYLGISIDFIRNTKDWTLLNNQMSFLTGYLIPVVLFNMFSKIVSERRSRREY